MRALALAVLVLVTLGCTVSRENDPRIVGYWQESPIAPWVYFFRADGTGGQIHRHEIDPGKESYSLHWWTEGDHLFIQEIDDDETQAAKEGVYSFAPNGALQVGPYAFGRTDVVLRKFDQADPKWRKDTRRRKPARVEMH